jgi:putative ABC transport system substrate-binding protein
MKRRQVLLSTVSMLATSGLHAQTPRLRRVAIAMPVAPEAPNEGIVAFRQRMAELGWVEGRNIEYVYAYAGGDARRYEPVIAELLAAKPDVLLAYFGPMALIAKRLTKEVPIVFTIASNPEEIGLVASLARPGGNVTGTSTRALELDGKRFELLREIKPGMQRVAVLVNPDVPEVARRFSESYAKIASKLGLQFMTVEARSAEELGPAFDRMAREGVQGMLGTADGTHLFQLRAAVVGHAARVAIPAMYVDERYVEAGGLVSYGTDNVDQTRRGAPYVDKILRGAKPADLPVEEPTKFRMALNLKTARALKIGIPQSVLVRADQVID